MIWHYYPRDEFVFRSIMKEERILYHLGQSGIAQVTAAMALVEICLNTSTHDRRGLAASFKFQFRFPLE
jgi:hypothetical protein